MTTIQRSKVAKLLSATEHGLYEASRRGCVDDHGSKRLGSLITAARKLRDKYAARASQQRAEARGKRDPRNTRVAQGDDNTRVKKEIFDDVLTRLEAARGRAEARANPDAPPTSRRAQKASARANAARARKEAGVAESTTGSKKKVAKKKVAKKGTVKKRVAKKAAKKKAAKKKTSALAHAEKAPKGAGRARKPQQAATKAHLAHGAAAGRRSQARRDKRG